MFSARIYAAHLVFYSYLTVRIWHFMIRRIGDCALSSAVFSPTIPLLYDVTRSSPDDEFQEMHPAKGDSCRQHTTDGFFGRGNSMILRSESAKLARGVIPVS